MGNVMAGIVTCFFGGGIGPPELLIILFLLVLFFGARKLPELAKGLGEGIKEFKKASREITSPEDSTESSKEQKEDTAK